MATLLELTAQGDVATISDESHLANVKLMTPQQLYELWERQNWQAHANDLSKDDEDWAALDQSLTSRQFDDLSDAAWSLNRREVDVPFSRAASRILRSEPE